LAWPLVKSGKSRRALSAPSIHQLVPPPRVVHRFSHPIVRNRVFTRPCQLILWDLLEQNFCKHFRFISIWYTKLRIASRTELKDLAGHFITFLDDNKGTKKVDCFFQQLIESALDVQCHLSTAPRTHASRGWNRKVCAYTMFKENA
jgi:hypothetical protein